MQNKFNQNSFNGSYYQPPVDKINFNELAFYENKKRLEKKQIKKTGLFLGGAIILYIIIQIVISSLVAYGSLKDLYNSSPIFQNCLNIIGVHFLAMGVPFLMVALILKKQFVTPIVPLKNVKAKNMFAWVSFGMGCCIVANYATNLIILLFKHFGYELEQGDMLKPNNIFACIVLIFSTAIVPAIIEEFAMRCCSLGVLQKFGKGFAVFAVSIVFGLLHMNVIQFVFAFIVGLALAYVTIKTESVVPAMLIHFFNNGISCVNDIVAYFSNEDVAKNVASIIFFVWIALAIIGFIYLAYSKELLPKKKAEPKSPYELSFGEKLASLLPGFIVPLIALIIISATTIHKI